MTTLQHPVLGIDIGGTNMRFALVDGALHLRAYEQLSTQAVFAHGAQPTQKLAQQIRAYCARHLQGEAPAAVSIGFPSTINRARTVVLQTPNIEGIPRARKHYTIKPGGKKAAGGMPFVTLLQTDFRRSDTNCSQNVQTFIV